MATPFDDMDPAEFAILAPGTLIRPGTIMEYKGRQHILNEGLAVKGENTVVEMTLKILKMKAALERISKDSNEQEFRNVALEALV
jgi:hypothetical protein|tara:strand:- start:714 stop:968 length:255 start_codon:yes stop_codon:yes gene_type:complete